MKNTKQMRDSFGRFAPKLDIVNGRLYELDRQVVVRARKKCQNGYLIVSYHKDLFGIVNPTRLSKIDKRKVNQYLKNA